MIMMRILTVLTDDNTAPVFAYTAQSVKGFFS